MANTVQFDVDDNSPLLSYFPFTDSLSTPNFSAGWNPLFDQSSLAGAPLQTGNSISAHVTSLNGAALQIQWQGVGIRLIGSTIQASVTVQLDDSPSSSNTTTDSDTLYAVDNLTDTNHTIKLTTVTSGSAAREFVVFQEAVITAGIPSPDNSSSTTFTEQPLDDTLVTFSGNWNINSTTSFRQSQSANDTALVTFLGTALIIRGALAPNGAKFSVLLDNSTTSGLSSKAPFTQNDTVLFYASGLDPQQVHRLEIINEDGGDLMLPLGSIFSFSSGSPNPPSPRQTGVPGNNASNSSGLSSGTVAALALAGILAFILITASLFYFLVYRPRKRKRRQLRRQRIQQAAQLQPDDPDDTVLDIGRARGSRSSQSPQQSPIKSLKSKKSTGSGFLAWKQQARGGNAKELKNLGLFFRHSDSAKSKPVSGSLVDEEEWEDIEPPSAKSYGFTIPDTVESSQQPSQGLGKGKEKGRKPSLWSLRSKKSSKSSSPSYNVDLPTFHKDSGSSDKTNGRARYSYYSEFTDITYMSTPSDPSRQLSFNTASNPSNPSNGPSKPPSSSPNTHERVDSTGLLLLHQESSENPPQDVESMVSQAEPAPTILSATQSSYRTNEPEVYVQEVSSAYSDSLNLRRSGATPAPGLALAVGHAHPVPRDIDRGSVRTYDVDDARSLLGPATARAAIRGLSPRISEVPSSRSSADIEPRRTEAVPPPHVHHLLASTGISNPRGRLTSDETIRPDASGRFLDVRASSPFRLDFLGGQRREGQDPKKAARLSAGSRVRFDEHTAPPSVSSDKGKGRAAESSQRMGLPSKQAFRLTPQIPLSPPRSVAESSVQTSFLDFSGSSGASMSGSNETSESSSGRRLSAFTGLPPRSRWSSTTAPSSTGHGQPSSSSDSEPSHVETSPEQSPPSYHFPFPVSLPASPHHPEGYKPSPPTSLSAQLSNEEQSADPRLHPSVLPTNPLSPAESVPMSISVHSRHSDSESHVDLDTRLSTSHSSHLPPHPPLPLSLPATPTPQTDTAATQVPEVTVTTPTSRIIFGPRSPNRRDSSNSPTQMRMGPRPPAR
ncbi:hypothetical protein D9758_006765 [Tetrapyrgos nigripes]|uniref:Uncharacterized protein n=1 Tax=Tetrapyrgos nigripes TaxID=182062 RepID=A0A8H5FTI8_9AGAR|nr:hypothetical protein D9758_006765 [Tetrapyrgos nigripes]